MRTIVKVSIVSAMLVLGASVIAASSFTTATLDRTASIDVVNDGQGAISLEDGNSGGVVTISGGELSINFAVGSASGVNVNSRYELGDPNDPSNQRAFNVTNQDSVSHTITLNYTVTSGDGTGDATNSTEFRVFNTSGTRVATISEEDSGQSFTATAGESFAVVVIVDTSVGTVNEASDLSGTLRITAT